MDAPSLAEAAPGESVLPDASPEAVARLAAEAAHLRLKVMSLAAENERLRDTVSYQLGNLIVHARTWRGFCELPGGLLKLRQHSLALRGRRNKAAEFDAQAAERISRLSARALDMSIDEITKAALRECRTPALTARLLADLAAAVQSMDFAKSLGLARRALEIEPTPRRKVWLAGFLYDVGMIEEPLRLLDDAATGVGGISAAAQRRHHLLKSLSRVRRQGLSVAPRKAYRTPVDRSLMYVAASSFPHHITGYAARTHSLVKAIGRSGWRVETVTRPGYPADRNDSQAMTGREASFETDGVVYTRLAGPPSNTTPYDEYVEAASRSLFGHIEKCRPALVHAASNYVNAAPALAAARRAGLPFLYEVRGLWELTNAARAPHWEGSERFELQRQQETFVAQEADAVVAISEGLRRELVSRGVDERKIAVVPNSVDPQVFSPRPKDERLQTSLGLGDRRVLGFLGSMTGYEGLVDLVSALSRLRKDGLDVCALLVGDGPAFREVREAAREQGVEEHLIMPGRVPHADAPRWYSVMDIAVYPRRPARVTELVPPLKPLEAMAMELPVVASNVSAISETVIHGSNGFLFDKGDLDGLIQVLGGVLDQPDESRAIGRAARADVERRFTWTRAAENLGLVYGQNAQFT
ncbi:glycosyltransferase [Brevundimonas lutea]|uniref:glycosyltransferase n=1 Tax=Brevundimonas lutea TaxID=2293980 RepID=UPI000F01D226|nr:glycosyltransferase [Brevundimonas lutea]